MIWTDLKSFCYTPVFTIDCWFLPDCLLPDYLPGILLALSDALRLTNPENFHLSLSVYFIYFTTQFIGHNNLIVLNVFLLQYENLKRLMGWMRQDNYRLVRLLRSDCVLQKSIYSLLKEPGNHARNMHPTFQCHYASLNSLCAKERKSQVVYFTQALQQGFATSLCSI